MSKTAAQISKLALVIIIFAGLVISSYWYWHYNALHPSTDDAYVQANVVHVAAEVTGPVSAIYVQDHQHVAAGQPLFDIDPTPFIIQVARARAELKNTIQQVDAAEQAVNAAKAMVSERQAQLDNAKTTAKRYNILIKQKLTAQAEVDKANEALNVTQAELTAAQKQLAEAQAKRGDPGDNNAAIEAARASLARAELNLKHTHVVAKTTGYLVNFALRVGSMITAEQPQFAIVDNQTWWVQANFKETDLGRIKPNEAATIKLDMYPDHVFHGKVQSISSGSGASFSVLPPENATGNWVKVTQRFPVKVLILDPNPNYPLRMGASSTVTINTTKTHDNTNQ